MESITLCKNILKLLTKLANFTLDKVEIDRETYYFRDGKISIVLFVKNNYIDIQVIEYYSFYMMAMPTNYNRLNIGLDSEEGKILKGYLDFINFVKG